MRTRTLGHPEAHERAVGERPGEPVDALQEHHEARLDGPELTPSASCRWGCTFAEMLKQAQVQTEGAWLVHEVEVLVTAGRAGAALPLCERTIALDASHEAAVAGLHARAGGGAVPRPSGGGATAAAVRHRLSAVGAGGPSLGV